MMNKYCKICGKLFQAKQSNYVCCSPECRKKNQKLFHKKYDEKYRQIYHERYGKGTKIYEQRYAAYKAKHRRIKYCSECNAELPNANQKICLDCLLRMYLNGDKRARQMLSNRGYDKETVLAEIEQRGITK